MRRATALILLLTLPLLAGCLQGDSAPAPAETEAPSVTEEPAQGDAATSAPSPTDDRRITPAEVVETAQTFAGTWWRPDAALHLVAARATTSDSLWGISPSVDGRNASWTFGFAAPGADTAFSATFDGDGDLVASQEVPAARLGFTAATARTHAALAKSALDTRELLAALRANATTSGFVEGAAGSVSYVLTTGTDGPAWTVTLDRGTSRYVAIVAAENWTVLEAGTRSRYGGGSAQTPEATSPLKVEGIYGQRAFSAAGAGALESPVENLTLHVSLSAGAVPIDLSRIIVRYSDGTSVREMNYSEASAEAIWNGSSTSQFRIDELRDDDDSFSAAAPVATSGDLLKLQFYDVDIAARTRVTVAIIPEAGASISADFVTPPTYGTKQYVVLR